MIHFWKIIVYELLCSKCYYTFFCLLNSYTAILMLLFMFQFYNK